MFYAYSDTRTYSHHICICRLIKRHLQNLYKMRSVHFWTPRATFEWTAQQLLIKPLLWVHVYLFKNNFHPANTITCVLKTNLATYLLMNGVCGKGCCSYQLKRWVFLQTPLNCECKCVICLALEILQNSYRHVDSSLNTFNMCWHMITQYILFFSSLCIFWRSSGIKVSVA